MKSIRFAISWASLGSILSVSLLICFILILGLASRGSPAATCLTNSDDLILLNHVLPPIVLSAILFALSLKAPLEQLNVIFWRAIIAFCLLVIAMHSLAEYPRWLGGWRT